MSRAWSSVQLQLDALNKMLTLEQLEEKYTKNLIDCNDFSPPQGWLNIVDRLLNDLVTVEPNVSIGQMKEKFGGLRCYSDAKSDLAYELIAQAEIESNLTCQVCGETGVNRNCGGYWYMTLCKHHFKARMSCLRNKDRAGIYVEYVYNSLPTQMRNLSDVRIKAFEVPEDDAYQTCYESFIHLNGMNKDRVIKEVLDRRKVIDK